MLINEKFKNILQNEIFFYLDLHSLLTLRMANKKLNTDIVDFISTHKDLFDNEISARIKTLREERKRAVYKVKLIGREYDDKRYFLKSVWLIGTIVSTAFVSAFTIVHFIYNKMRNVDYKEALIAESIASLFSIFLFQCVMAALMYNTYLVGRYKKQEEKKKHQITKNIKNIKNGYGRFFKEKDKDIKNNVDNEALLSNDIEMADVLDSFTKKIR